MKVDILSLAKMNSELTAGQIIDNELHILYNYHTSIIIPNGL
jgi:hypothetical protein